MRHNVLRFHSVQLRLHNKLNEDKLGATIVDSRIAFYRVVADAIAVTAASYTRQLDEIFHCSVSVVESDEKKTKIFLGNTRRLDRHYYDDHRMFFLSVAANIPRALRSICLAYK